ncbi:MAG TPA: NUDIX domain-containing protein [Acidimicrobiales bacterium]|nr:NUDIX domain-containing protein [Acidimicrobiales bacterium]
MPAVSAAFCCFRRTAEGAEVLLVHPGGPYFAHRDEGVWSIPKGLAEPGEELLETARREFTEEVGAPPPAGSVIELGEVRQRNGKRVVAFAAESDDPALAFVCSNDFELEWPPRSGELQRFPECDRGAWCSLAEAKRVLVEAQGELIDRLQEVLAGELR